MQAPLLSTRPSGQLLKWVGNKYRFAYEIVNYFPKDYRVYYEPFVGTGAILATLQPHKAVAGDALKPLIELWWLVKDEPEMVIKYYSEQWYKQKDNRTQTFANIKASYNNNPNALDLLFISRTCYGGVIRFTTNGAISTPLGPHNPIPPDSFKNRVYEWQNRVKNCEFNHTDYTNLIRKAGKKDLVYCDPPYKDSQSILYGAQSFNLQELFHEISKAKKRGAYIALSIDGTKKSGLKNIELDIPEGLFQREVFIDCGHSMLRRFQINGKSAIGEKVRERLLLTW